EDRGRRRCEAHDRAGVAALAITIGIRSRVRSRMGGIAARRPIRAIKKLTGPAGIPVRVAVAPENVDAPLVREVWDVEEHEAPLGCDDLRLVVRWNGFQASISRPRSSLRGL